MRVQRKRHNAALLITFLVNIFFAETLFASEPRLLSPDTVICELPSLRVIHEDHTRPFTCQKGLYGEERLKELLDSFGAIKLSRGEIFKVFHDRNGTDQGFDYFVIDETKKVVIFCEAKCREIRTLFKNENERDLYKYILAEDLIPEALNTKIMERVKKRMIEVLKNITGTSSQTLSRKWCDGKIRLASQSKQGHKENELKKIFEEDTKYKFMRLVSLTIGCSGGGAAPNSHKAVTFFSLVRDSKSVHPIGDREKLIRITDGGVEHLIAERELGREESLEYCHCIFSSLSSQKYPIEWLQASNFSKEVSSSKHDIIEIEDVSSEEEEKYLSRPAAQAQCPIVQATHAHQKADLAPPQKSRLFRLPDNIADIYEAVKNSKKERAVAAFSELKKIAESEKKLTAMRYLSTCYKMGYGCEKNRDLSKHWRRRLEERTDRITGSSQDSNEDTSEDSETSSEVSEDESSEEAGRMTSKQRENLKIHRTETARSHESPLSDQQKPRTFRLPSDIEGLFEATKCRKKERTIAAFAALYKIAKNQKRLTAMKHLSTCYKMGYGCEKSRELSRYWRGKAQESMKGLSQDSRYSVEESSQGSETFTNSSEDEGSSSD